MAQLPNLSAQYKAASGTLHVRAWVEDELRTTVNAVISHTQCTLELRDEAGARLTKVAGATDPAGAEYVQFSMTGLQVAAEHNYLLVVKIAMPASGEVVSGVFPMPTEAS